MAHFLKKNLVKTHDGQIDVHTSRFTPKVPK